MMKRPLSLGADLSKIIIVEDGVNIRKFKMDKEKIKLKKEFNIDYSKVILIFASRLFELKGIEDLIIVAEDLVSKYNNIVFLIVGTGPLETKLRHRTDKIKDIMFLGYRNDIPKLLKMSDIFLLPSYSEGLSPAILEACASGLPIISTTVGSNPDIIKNGINGFLTEPGNKIELKNNIIKLVENKDLREKMGRNNKNLIIKNFDLNLVVEKFLLELKKAL